MPQRKHPQMLQKYQTQTPSQEARTSKDIDQIQKGFADLKNSRDRKMRQTQRKDVDLKIKQV